MKWLITILALGFATSLSKLIFMQQKENYNNNLQVQIAALKKELTEIRKELQEMLTKVHTNNSAIDSTIQNNNKVYTPSTGQPYLAPSDLSEYDRYQLEKQIKRKSFLDKMSIK